MDLESLEGREILSGLHPAAGPLHGEVGPFRAPAPGIVGARHAGRLPAPRRGRLETPTGAVAEKGGPNSHWAAIAGPVGSGLPARVNVPDGTALRGVLVPEDSLHWTYYSLIPSEKAETYITRYRVSNVRHSGGRIDTGEAVKLLSRNFSVSQDNSLYASFFDLDENGQLDELVPDANGRGRRTPSLHEAIHALVFGVRSVPRGKFPR